jgi:hypothetical protein
LTMPCREVRLHSECPSKPTGNAHPTAGLERPNGPWVEHTTGPDTSTNCGWPAAPTPTFRAPRSGETVSVADRALARAAVIRELGSDRPTVVIRPA